MHSDRIRIPKRAISLSGKDPTILTKPKYSPKPPNKSHYKPPKPNGTPSTSTHTAHSSLSQKRTLTRNVISDEDEEEDLLNETDSDDSVQALKLRKSSTRKRLRPPPANDLEPNPKRRRTNNNHNDHDPKRKKKRKSKGPKARFCTICKAKLHADNHGKYCGELCKKEGAQQNKQKRADEKKQKVQKEEALEAKKEKAADKANKDNIRKTTACKFRAIFAGDNKAGSNLEKRIYKFAGSEINDVYSQKVKELRYNLNENRELLESVLSGELTLKKLSTMNNAELACKSLVQDRKQREAKFNAENTLVHKPVFGKPMEGKHFVDNIADNDTNMDIDEHLNASVSASVSVSAMSPTPTALSGSSTTSTLSTPSITVSDTEKKVAVFDAHEMSELLKNCKTKMKGIEIKKEEDMPLQIHVDSSEEEEGMEDDDVEVSVLEPPEPPRRNPSYYSHNTVARSNSNVRNVWNGWIKRSSSEVGLDLSLFFIGGKETKLKAVIPKRLQINGRTKFKVISDCLGDLVKVTRSKFTVILAAKCVDDAYRSEYAEIIKECRESKKGFMIDMKQSKARIKIILLPRFRHSDKEWFDVAEMQKLWKCSLPATDDLWALLTVYAKDRDKDSDKEREKTPEKGKDKYNKHRDRESDSSNSARKDKHRDRNRSDDRDRDRKRDRERDKHRNSYKRRESYTYSSKSNDRARDRDSERDRDRTHCRDHRGDRNKDRRNKYRYKEDRYDENKRKSISK